VTGKKTWSILPLFSPCSIILYRLVIRLKKNEYPESTVTEQSFTKFRMPTGLLVWTGFWTLHGTFFPTSLLSASYTVSSTYDTLSLFLAQMNSNSTSSLKPSQHILAKWTTILFVPSSTFFLHDCYSTFPLILIFICLNYWLSLYVTISIRDSFKITILAYSLCQVHNVPSK
jgi:hypothetical protein